MSLKSLDLILSLSKDQAWIPLQSCQPYSDSLKRVITLYIPLDTFPFQKNGLQILRDHFLHELGK